MARIALSAVVVQEFSQLRSTDGTTRADIVLEWNVLESMVRHQRDELKLIPFPGSSKTARALAGGGRLSPTTYLRGPRVFGFTGVYRPYCVDTGVLDTHGDPGEAARDLVEAWEQDRDLYGFLHYDLSTEGGQLRRWIAISVESSLRAGESRVEKHTARAKELAQIVSTVGEGPRVRALLRAQLFETSHVLRKEAVELIDQLPATTDGAPDRSVAEAIRPGASDELARVLDAVTRFERLAVTMDNCFRSTLSTFRLITPEAIATDELLRDGASSIRRCADEAIAAVAAIDQIGTELSERVAELVAPVREATGPVQFFDGLVNRHLAVQQAKGKSPWITDLEEGWVPRQLYREQPEPRDVDGWMHPYRLSTLYSFVEGTR
ncbi:hypothetical protein [Rhodococcus sp. IEGM 1408]|uniref:hypothetical protein n=1 Tax=Rhodococcus sp. IEGM 1408 TaxID=3082220 RepID=UPI002952E5B9|nr:hypothetical protein [Rhodococcus sp. IEGM 1408]MDV8003013.1 hypothetical protein [Rhodococcus sp. IEGM 1408]